MFFLQELVVASHYVLIVLPIFIQDLTRNANCHLLLQEYTCGFDSQRKQIVASDKCIQMLPTIHHKSASHIKYKNSFYICVGKDIKRALKFQP